MLEVIDRVPFPAIGVWNEQTFANVRAKRVFGDPLPGEVVRTLSDAFRTACETRSACSTELAGFAARMIPLIGIDREAQAAVALVDEGAEGLPALIAEFGGGTNWIWPGVVYAFPEIVLTVRPQRGTIDFWNRSWVAYTGRRRADSDILLEIIDPADRGKFETVWRGLIAHGHPVTLDLRLRDAVGSARWHRLRAVPIHGKNGRVVKWMLTFADVDDMVEARLAVERSQERLDVLAEASRALQVSLDTTAVAEAACRFSVRRLCDAALALNARDERELFTALSGSSFDSLAPSLVRRHDLPTWQHFCPLLPGKSPIAHAVTIPVRARRHHLGTLILGFQSHEKSLELEDLELFEAFADRLALALDNARLYANERRVAGTLQSALLPRTLPRFDGFIMNAAYLPGNDEDRVGGDWYDAFELRDGRIGISIGDVAGRGIRAAALMGTLRQTMRTVALDDPSPDRVLTLANLAANGSEVGLATAFFAAIDPIAMRIEYATAGHPPPFLVDEDGSVSPLACTGMALGIVEDLQVELFESALPRAGALLLYTDGVVEHSRDLFSGTETLRRRFSEWYREGAAASALTFARSLLPEQHVDDAVVFFTRFLPVRSLDIRIPALRRHAPAVRRALVQFTRGIELRPQRAFDLILATGEAVNNAIEHAYASDTGILLVRAAMHGPRVTVEVEDHGTWRAGESHPDRGRGLWIIDSLADDVHLEHTPSGTLVRMVFDDGRRRTIDSADRREVEAARS